MRQATVKDHLGQEQIRGKMQESETKEQFQRWQAIYMVGKGLRAEQAADFVGVARGTIYQWVFQYNHEGPDSFLLQGRGGRRSGLMSFQEEAEFLKSLKAEATKGEIVGAFWFRERLEKKLGCKVSKDYLYDLLHRHGWRKVIPRPSHPKADADQQEEFKKNFRSRWQPPLTRSRRRITGR
jgi:transposase